MFKPGAILKVTVTNFVTYSYVEMYPGPNLNMLIGPNGTGKSTIVAAIILGLGGNPKTVGRGTRISEYVKHNCEDSIISIVLKGNKNMDDFTVTREFNKHDRTNWKLNGQRISQKDIMEHISQFKIQVDNLCQFLPQDRVADFAKLNKQDLLKQTQIALCREDLMEKQVDLIAKRERHRYILNSASKIDQKLAEIKDANMRLEGKVANFKKKNNYKKTLDTITRKEAWVKFLGTSNKRNELKDKKQKALEILNHHKNAAKPIETAIANSRKNVTNLQAKYNETSTALKTLKTRINNKNDRLQSFKESINHQIQERDGKVIEMDEREREINSSIMRMDQLTRDKAEAESKYGGDKEVIDKLQQLNTDLRKVSTHLLGMEEQKTDIIRTKRQKVYEIKNLESEIERMENIKHQRLQVLQRLDRQAYEATLWLRENKKLFKGQVFEPMMLELNVINPKHALYIENAIAFRDKVAFTCTLKEDMNILIRAMREKKLSINVLHSGNDTSLNQYRSALPIEQLRKYGFHSYVVSLVTGPEPIIKYLCKTNKIHNIPVGNQSTNGCIDKIPKEISMFYSDNYRFSISYSRYSGEKSTRQNEISSDGTLSISIDQLRIETVYGQLQELRRTAEQFDDELRIIDQKKSDVSEQNNKLRESVQILRSSRQKIDQINDRIQSTRRKIQQMQSEKGTKEEIEELYRNQINTIRKKMVAFHEEIQTSFKLYSEKVIEYLLDRSNLNTSHKQITFLENQSLDIRKLVQEAEAKLNRLKEEFANVMNESKRLLQRAKELSNGFTPDDAGFNDFRAEYNRLPEDLQVLTAEKEMMLSKIDCLSNAADDAEMVEYEQRLLEISKIEENINRQKIELDDIVENIDKLQEEWIEPLKELVHGINERFSLAFERMGCVGEVDIYTGGEGGEKDFEKYGLNIRVTYRDGEPLQELNTVTQSGGERAVATAAFMLSLQELTPVPFRCVDEINQGMDTNNERRIFELLVESTSQPDTSQYFLITPKLVPDLRYVPTMKVHIVHNGPFVCEQAKWNAVNY